MSELRSAPDNVAMNRSKRTVVWLLAPVLYVGAIAGLTESNRDNVRWLRHGREVDAVIVREGHKYEDGQAYDVRYRGGPVAEIDLTEDLDVGDTVTVLVHPADPTRVATRSFLQGEIALGIVITAALYAAPVIALIVAIVRRRRRTRGDRPLEPDAGGSGTLASWIEAAVT